MATTTTTTTPTGWAADAAYQNWQFAQNAANNLQAQYPATNMLAGWDPAQNAGYNAVMNGTWQGQDAMQGGQAAAYGASNFQPWQVHTANAGTATGGPAVQAGMTQIWRPDVRDVNASKFTDANLQSYMNPYTSSVIDTTMQQLGRQNDILNTASNARAAVAGAFGGSRQAVANSENNRAFLNAAGTTAANLNNQNFMQAQGAIQNDQANALRAWQGNQAADLSVQQANLGARQQTQLANAAAIDAMNRFNATQTQQSNQYNADNIMRSQIANQSAAQSAANTRLAGGTALNGMGLDQQKFNLNNANALYGMGAAAQAQAQGYLDESTKRWQAAQQYPLTQLAIRQQGLNGYSSGTTQTSPYYSNTGANILSGALGAGALGAGILSNWDNISSGASSLYNGLSGMWSGASSMPNSIYDTGAMAAEDLFGSLF